MGAEQTHRRIVENTHYRTDAQTHQRTDAQYSSLESVIKGIQNVLDEDITLQAKRIIDNKRRSIDLNGTRARKKTKQDTTNTLLRDYKRNRDLGRYLNNPKRELAMLNTIVEQGELTRSKWNWLHKRWQAVWDRVYQPNARNKIVGVKIGGLTEEERRDIRNADVIIAIGRLLDGDKLA